MIQFLLYSCCAVIMLASILLITRRNPVHALLNLVLILLSLAVIFYLLGAPFAAALQVMIYAGAITVLFIFVVMMLNLGELTEQQESQWLKAGNWLLPLLCSAILWFQLLASLQLPPANLAIIDAQSVGADLFGAYLLLVELASFLLLSALIGAFHIVRPFLLDTGQAFKRHWQDDNLDGGPSHD